MLLETPEPLSILKRIGFSSSPLRSPSRKSFRPTSLTARVTFCCRFLRVAAAALDSWAAARLAHPTVNSVSTLAISKRRMDILLTDRGRTTDRFFSPLLCYISVRDCAAPTRRVSEGRLAYASGWCSTITHGQLDRIAPRCSGIPANSATAPERLHVRSIATAH